MTPTLRVPPEAYAAGPLLVKPTESFICLFIGLNKSAQDLGIYNVGDMPKEYNPARKIFVLMTGGNLHWAKMKNNCDNKNLLTNTNKNYVN